MLQILLMIYVLAKVGYTHKRPTGDSKKDKDLLRYQALRASRSDAAKILSLAFICISVLGTFVTGIYFVHAFKDDGTYAFTGKTEDLNDLSRVSEVPEAGTYVTMSFNLVGDSFDPIYEGTNHVYYPVVLDMSSGSGGRPSVFAICIDRGEMEILESYSGKSKSGIKAGNDMGGEPVLEYSGRIVELLPEFEAVYREAVKYSGIDEADYIVRPMVLNTEVDQKEERDRLIKIMAICHSFFTYAVLFVLNEMIDEGKLD